MKPALIVGCIAAIAGIALGRFTAPAKIEYRDKVRVVTVKDTKRVRVTTKPDGTVTRTETVIAERNDARRETVSTPVVPRWNVSVLGGANLKLEPTFGAHVQYRLLGPVNVGAWGLSSGVGGVSLGVTF